MTDLFIGNHGSGQVTHDLMHIDKDSPSVLGQKSDRLHMRVTFSEARKTPQPAK